VKRWKRKPRVSPYRRLEAQLGYSRAALSDAAAQYTRALEALIDLLGFYDRTAICGLPMGKVETERLVEIREIAKGKL
jgi:hypothetical protein